MPDIYPESGNLTVLNALGAVGGPYNGAKVRWWEAAILPNANTVLADLPIAAFSGNALSAAVVWAAGYKDFDNVWKLPGVSKDVIQTALTVSSDLNGWLLVGDPSGTPYLLASSRFAAPQIMNQIGKGSSLLPLVSLVDGVDGIVYSKVGKLKGLTALVQTGKFLDGPVVRLMTNLTEPTISDGIGAYVEATFPGYAESAPVVWGAPFIDSDAGVKVAGATVQFTAGVITVPQQITGWYLVGDPGGSEYVVRAFWYDVPVNINVQYDGIVVEPLYELKGAA